MWSPSQLSRTQSTHSVALSVDSMTSSSSQNSLYSQHTASSTPDTNYSEHEHDRQKHSDEVLSSYAYEKPSDLVQSPQHGSSVPFNLDEMMPPLWKPKKRILTLNSREHFQVAAKQHSVVHNLEMQRRMSESTASDDTHATLAEEDPETVHDFDMDLKTPTVPRATPSGNEASAVQTTGPMSSLLHSLLLRVADVERAQPTVMANDYSALRTRFAELEVDHRSILESHNDLLALRNDDLMNLIKVRGLLADEKREHAAIRRLRDEDLQNVLVLREKLAQDTWSGKLQLTTSSAQQEKRSPSQQNRNSRPDSDDLWKQAKTAAMEQRVLELEKANAELRATAATSTAAANHTVAAPVPSGVLDRMENMFEDSLRQRERMASRVQQLRSEKEVLQKELAGLEDRNSELEAMVERSKRGVSVSGGSGFGR